jgi:Endonuclease NucS
LEEFLVGNWKSIGWGRPLEIWTSPDGQSGHQFVTPIGRLDFLCSDHQADALIVVELKRGRPSDKVAGQVARYMGYVRAHLAKPSQPVEGLIIAHEADEPLRYAVAAFPGLQLMTYAVTFQLDQVEEPTAQLRAASRTEGRPNATRHARSRYLPARPKVTILPARSTSATSHPVLIHARA